MKIVHIAEYLPSTHDKMGGAEQAAQKIINLTSLGNEVFVLTSSCHKNVESNIFAIKTLDYYIGSMGLLSNIIIPFDLISYFSCLKRLKQIRPDIVHIHKFDRITFSAIAAAKKLNIPVVFSVYDYLLFCPTAMLLKPDYKVCTDYRSKECKECLKNKRGGFIRNLFLGMTHRIYRKYTGMIDHFVVLSGSSKDILINNKIPKENISVVYLPFDKPEKRRGKIENGSILYVGWIEPHKGLHVLLNALPKVIEKSKSAKLYVIGGYDSNPRYYDEIQSIISNLGISDNVIILGKKSAPEVSVFLRKAEVVVIPEQWENMSPLFLIEAMASEKPIVATDIGGIPEFIKDHKNGLLVKPGNSIELADKIILLLNDKKRATALGKNAGRSFSQNFDSKRILENLIKSYMLAAKHER